LVTVIPTLDEAKLFYSTALAVIGSTMFCFKSAKRFPAPERASPALPIPTYVAIWIWRTQLLEKTARDKARVVLVLWWSFHVAPSRSCRIAAVWHGIPSSHLR
jgi:hypothetical protein